MFTSQMIKKKIKSDYILFSAHKIVVWRNMVAVKVTIHRDLVSKSSLEETNLGILLRCRKINLVTVNKLQLCSQKNKGVMWTLPTESSFSCDHMMISSMRVHRKLNQNIRYPSMSQES